MNAHSRILLYLMYCIHVKMFKISDLTIWSYNTDIGKNLIITVFVYIEIASLVHI